MHEPLSEHDGCALLARLFRARGFAIRRNVTFKEGDVEFRVDGWDAKARVGFEFLSSEAHDHDDLTLGEFKRVMAAQQRGELALFIIDEAEQLTEADLAAAAGEFLDEIAARRPRKPAARRAVPVRKPAAAKRTTARRPASKQPRGKAARTTRRR